jgi:hypothetical protein
MEQVAQCRPRSSSARLNFLLQEARMSKGTAEMSVPFACLETGCENVECEHLTWGPPYCMLRVEEPGKVRDSETKPSSNGYGFPFHLKSGLIPR